MQKYVTMCNRGTELQQLW